MNIDPDIAPIPPHCSIDAWSPQQPTRSGSADSLISTSYSPMEQFQDYWQTAVWSVDSPPAAPDMVDDLLPGMEPPGSYVNPQEVVPPESRYATASAPPHSFINTGYSQHSTWSSDVAPPTSTQYNPMELIQDPGQTPTWSVNSLPVAPYVEADLLPGTQPFNDDMIPQEFGLSEAKRAVEVKQKGCLDPGNGERKKRQRYDKRTVSILKNHYFENRYPSTTKKEDLANQTGLTVKQVDAWFADRRKRDPTTVKKNRKPYEQEARTTLEQYYHDLTGVAKHPSTLRKVYDERTLSILRKEYLEDPSPKMARKKDLADQTGLTPKQIGNWFSNCRRDERYAAEKKVATDAANRRSVESTSTEDSENVNPMEQPMYACQASTSKTLTNGNPSPPMARSTPNSSIAMFDKPPIMAPKGFQMPIQQFQTKMADRHSVESTSTEDSENVNPMEQPLYVYRVLTLVNGQPLSMPMTNSMPNLSMPCFPGMMPIFSNPPMMAPERFQMPMQQFPPQTAVNPTFQQTATMQNPVQPEVVNFYY